MSILQLVIIALIQGITEWLPISSSGHVLLASNFFGFTGRDEYLINAMAHSGTLLAVLIYFRQDIQRAVLGGIELLQRPFRPQSLSPAGHLAGHILASMPIALGMILIYEFLVPDNLIVALRSVETVATTTILFAIILWWADARHATDRVMATMRWRDSILIGASQAIAALLPGTSRSGITMTIARACGYSRSDSAKFSMLIGAPLLAAAGLYAFIQLQSAPDAVSLVTLYDGLIVAALSFLSGLASIHFLMVLLQRTSFLPFVVYRIILGIMLFISSPTLGLV